MTAATGSSENGAFFIVELFCTETNLARRVAISYPDPARQPVALLDVKKKVQDEFGIPVCVQSLLYEGHGHGDETTLARAGVRSGDAFQVRYASEGDCKAIEYVTGWFATVWMHLASTTPSLTTPMQPALNEVLSLGIEEELIEKLAFEYLFPWLDARKYANKLHFVACGGLEVVMRVYAAIQRHPWERSHLKLKYMEYGILRVLWNLSETFELRRQILEQGGLELCMVSLLRRRLEEGNEIVDEQPQHRAHSWVLVENIGAALGLLCK